MIVVALMSACGSGGGGSAETRELLAALGDARDESRAFRFVDRTLDGKTVIVVEGLVEDDLRYSGTVAVNGKKIYQQVVSDDSVALRVIDVNEAAAAIAAVERTDQITASALREGRWVVDHTVAPPLLAAAASAGDEEEATADRPNAGRGRTNLVGEDPFIDGAQVLNYAERAIRSGFGAGLFNPDAIDYSALDDPWRADADKELEDDGIKRYDVAAPPLPPPAERGKRQTLPTIENFRKMVVYVRGERAFEVREQISIEDRREFRRAESGRAAEFYLKLRDGAKAGSISDELRERTMDYRVTRFGGVKIELPQDATQGILKDVLPQLKTIFDFTFIGGDVASLTPGRSPLPGTGISPTPPSAASPAASPVASGAPTPSAAPAVSGSPAPGFTPVPVASP